ncbi:hypothetical protein TD95_003433 [Thielaviopsis punctulata]|uniref:CWH43-like N-terminal domain-containing protein n=1 Tax=Thielaviopsis punctulata TaxID=72032 RepID=A0A0F4ZDM3_9PEZI|nr:hypothetical protein TD95_003433 [Thielaviopsis punctulata]
MLFGIISYWMLPAISGVVWLGTLLAMLLFWTVHQNGKHLVDMNEHQSIAYISDLGALTLKPLFIAGSAVTVIFLDLSFVADRLLRHNGRLLPNVKRSEKVVFVLNIVFAITGSVGLLLLSIQDTWRHPHTHTIGLIIFLVGFVLSAVCACIEYHFLRRISIAIAFGTLVKTNKYNEAAVCEWVLAIIFSFYVFSYVMDLWPAVHTKHPETRHEKRRLNSLQPSSDGSTLVGPAMEEARRPRLPNTAHIRDF